MFIKMEVIINLMMFKECVNLDIIKGLCCCCIVLGLGI